MTKYTRTYSGFSLFIFQNRTYLARYLQQSLLAADRYKYGSSLPAVPRRPPNEVLPRRETANQSKAKERMFRSAASSVLAGAVKIRTVSVRGLESTCTPRTTARTASTAMRGRHSAPMPNVAAGCRFSSETSLYSASKLFSTAASTTAPTTTLPPSSSSPLDAFRDDVPRQQRMNEPVGRPWSVKELRRKSYDDLHKLWYVTGFQRLLTSSKMRVQSSLTPANAPLLFLVGTFCTRRRTCC
jgi:Mitochondrial 39-S ribosomal protein L47 (MRP-L47)